MNIYQSTRASLKTVLFVAHDIGGISSLTPLIQEATSKGYQTSLALDGPALSIFENNPLRIQFKRINSLPHCDYGIFSVSTNGALEKSIFIQQCVPAKSLLILEGWGTLGGFFTSDINSLNSFRSILCPDSLSKAHIETLVSASNHVTALEMPLTPCVSPPHSKSKNNVLYLFGAHESPTQAKFHTHTFNKTIHILSRHAVLTQNTHTVFLRPHPGYDSPEIEKSYFKALKESYPGLRIIDASVSCYSLEEALSRVRYVMSINSTESFKAHCSKRQGILLWYQDAEAFGVLDGRALYAPHIQNMIFHHEFIRVCTNEEELLRVFKENLMFTKNFTYSPHEIFTRCEEILSDKNQVYE